MSFVNSFLFSSQLDSDQGEGERKKEESEENKTKEKEAASSEMGKEEEPARSGASWEARRSRTNV